MFFPRLVTFRFSKSLARSDIVADFAVFGNRHSSKSFVFPKVASVFEFLSFRSNLGRKSLVGKELRRKEFSCISAFFASRKGPLGGSPVVRGL
jgi:hypothetical protein